MRQALVRKSRPGANVAAPYPRIAPVKGWMTSENLAAMPEDAAVVMDNWFPETDSVRMRRGSTTFATLDDADPIRTIMVYESGGTTEIFAAQGEYIFDVTAGGAISSPAVSSQTSDKYISTMFAVSGGQVLCTANGTDDILNYDGSAWSTPAVTGVTGGLDTLNYVFQSKSRLFYCQNGNADVWYLAADAIAGGASVLALGGLLTLGGTIIAGGSLTIDAGYGPDDYTAFLSSQGEVIIYHGSDPSDPTDWVLKGVFRISKPIGNRCIVKIAGDLGVLCADGLVSMTKAIQLDLAAAQKGAYSSNIRTAFNTQYNLTGGFFGWQIVVWPTAHMAVVNVPIVLDTQYEQYVLNVLTGAWARYTGMNAECFALANTTLYFGTVDGKVVQFEKGNSDDGMTVTATMIPAFSYMKQPGRLKHVKSMQVFFRGAGQYSIGLNIAADFEFLDTAIATQDISDTGGSLWDVAEWDVGTWSGTARAVYTRWLGVAGGGYYLAPVIFSQSGNDTSEDTDVQFLAMNLLTEGGAILG